MSQSNPRFSWADEFQEFLNAPEASPPAHLNASLSRHVQRSLNPAAWQVFSKAALVHVAMGTLSLLFCPQFGLGFTSSLGLMGMLMSLGDTICMFGCGALFLGGTALLVSFVLRPEEVGVIRRTQWIQFALLGTLSLGAFICLGASVVFTLAAVWLAGSVVGAALTFKLGWMLRSYFRRRLVHGI